MSVRLFTSDDDETSGSRRRGAILVVGPDGAAVRAAVSVLEGAGFCAITTSDPAKAMTFFEAAAFDVLVADATAADTRALMDHVRARRPLTAVVVLVNEPQDVLAEVDEAIARNVHRQRIPAAAARPA